MDFERRFGAMGRLYGTAALARLRGARAAVVGVGGVGSWTVEALARSGVGELVLIDMDDVCISNVNRQLPALDGNIGRLKVEALAERVRLINPECRVVAEPVFFTASSAERLLAVPFDVVVDAIDSVPNKCRLIAECRCRGQALVVCGGAGGRSDPTCLHHADLGLSRGDPLLTRVRRELRRHHDFPKSGAYGIDAVYSDEDAVFPQTDGTVCGQKEPGAGVRLNCDQGYGTASFVTGALGFAAASRAVRAIVSAARS